MTLFLLASLQLRAQSTAIPYPIHEIHIDTLYTIDRSSKSSASLTIIRCDQEQPSVEYTGKCGIELHGNSTLLAPKKSFEIELRDAQHKESVASILEMDPGSDFILLANYFDHSFMRNALAFQLWSRLGYYTPEYRFCTLFMNGEYQGMYMLVERIKVGPGRLNLGTPTSELQSSVLNTSPFLLKMDWDIPVPVALARSLTGVQIPLKAEYPKLEKLSYVQRTSIQKYISAVDDALISLAPTAFDDQFSVNAALPYDSLIDLTSFVDYFLLTELSKNPDGYKTSTYLYREAITTLNPNPKLKMGPVWDFDLAFDNVHYERHDEVEGWTFMQMGHLSNLHRMPVWWNALVCDAAFREKCKERLRYIQEVFSDQECRKLLFDAGFQLGAAVTISQKHWEKKYGAVWRDLGPLDRSMNEDLQRIGLFYSKRLQWMTENLETMDCVPPGIAYLEHLTRETMKMPPVQDSMYVSVLTEEGKQVVEEVGKTGMLLTSYKVIDARGSIVASGEWSDPLQPLSLKSADFPESIYYILFDHSILNWARYYPVMSSGIVFHGLSNPMLMLSTVNYYGPYTSESNYSTVTYRNMQYLPANLFQINAAKLIRTH